MKHITHLKWSSGLKPGQESELQRNAGPTQGLVPFYRGRTLRPSRHFSMQGKSSRTPPFPTSSDLQPFLGYAVAQVRRTTVQNPRAHEKQQPINPAALNEVLLA